MNAASQYIWLEYSIDFPIEIVESIRSIRNYFLTLQCCPMNLDQSDYYSPPAQANTPFEIQDLFSYTSLINTVKAVQDFLEYFLDNSEEKSVGFEANKEFYLELVLALFKIATFWKNNINQFDKSFERIIPIIYDQVVILVNYFLNQRL